MERMIEPQNHDFRCKARRMAAIAACCLVASLPLAAQELPFLAPAQPEQQPELELETVVVYGGLATPQMWKVSKGDHVLWVLGDATAPPGARWRFDEVEARLAESRLLLYPGQVDVDVGFFRVIGLLTQVPLAFKAVTKNPDNKTLKDVLPPEIYERWRVLKAAYDPGDKDIEKSRPSFALQQLERMIETQLREKPPEKPADKPAQKPAEQSKPARPRPLPPGPALRPLVDKAAKKHKVRIRTAPGVEHKAEVKNVRGMLKFYGEFAQVDVRCVTRRLEYLEHRIEYLKQRAAGTAPERAPDQVPECNEAELLLEKLKSGEIRDSEGILKTMDSIEQQVKLSNERLDAKWIEAAEAALANNPSSFAMLPAYRLKRDTGYLAKLKELGYEVEEPNKEEP